SHPLYALSTHTLPPLHPPLFPYTTLFRSLVQRDPPGPGPHVVVELQRLPRVAGVGVTLGVAGRVEGDHRDLVGHDVEALLPHVGDRKSTRLNSSHDQISYAVFCLKKKKKS